MLIFDRVIDTLCDPTIIFIFMFMFIEFCYFCRKMFGYQTRYNSINDVVVFVRI